MSLINEALKKAQHMRSAQQGSQPDPDAFARSRGGSRSLPLKWALVLIGGSAVLISASVFLTAYFMRPPVSSITIKSDERAAPSTPVVESAPTSIPAMDSPAGSPVKSAPLAETPEKSAAPSLTLPASIVASGTATPKPNQAPSIPALKIDLAAPATVAVPVAEEAPKIQKIVDSFRVTGVRMSGSDTKIILNDRVYRLNDLVDRTFGLKLVRVADGRLVFTDSNGVEYVRNY